MAVDLAGRIARAWVRSDRGRVSTLDLIGTGLTRLVSGHDLGLVRGGSGGVPETLGLLGAEDAGAVGADRPGGLLVRPDGIPLDERLRRLPGVRPSAAA